MRIIRSYIDEASNFMVEAEASDEEAQIIQQGVISHFSIAEDGVVTQNVPIPGYPPPTAEVRARIVEILREVQGD